MTHRERWWLAGALLLALVVRVVATMQARALNPDFYAPQMDALFHVEWARALANGTEYLDGPFFRAPLYPLFLAGVLQLAGDDLVWPRLVQAALGTATCTFVFLAARQLASTRTALLATLLCALTPLLAYFETELLLPVLECFFGTLALWCLLRAHRTQIAWHYLVAGGAIGAAAIVRPNFLAVAVVCGLWLVWQAAGTRLRSAALYALGVLIPIAPVAWVNASEGEVALIATQGGVNLWIGNNPASDGSTAIVPGTRPDWWGGYFDSIAQAEAAEGRKLSATEVSEHYSQRVWSWWRSEPQAAAALLWWKLRLLVLNHELGNNQEDAYFLATYTPILNYLPVRWWVLFAFGLLGLWVLRREPKHLGLALFVLTYAGTIVLFFVCARFRTPLLPPLCIASAAGMLYIVDALRARRAQPALLALLCVTTLATWSLATPNRVDTSLALGPWQEGVAHVRAGNDGLALARFDEAARRNADVWVVHKDRALALQRLGRLDEAHAAALRATQLAPRALDAQRTLVAIALARADLGAALSAARAAVAADPLSSDACYDLGRVIVAHLSLPNAALPSPAVDLATEAARALESGARSAREPQQAFNCLYALVELARLRNEQSVRLQAAEAACKLLVAPDVDGWYWRVHEQRLEALVALGRGAEASAEARRLVEGVDDERSGVLARFVR